MPFIYDLLAGDEKTAAGCFETTEPWSPLTDENFVWNYRNLEMTKDCVYLYFPGSFGTFHRGHQHVVREAYEQISIQYPDRRVIAVIAPSNAEYAKKKYGDVLEATNAFRFREIEWAIKYEMVGLDSVIVVDQNPMLNHLTDQNIPDHLKYFIEKNVCAYEELEVVPFIITGKDLTFNFPESVSHLIRSLYVDALLGVDGEAVSTTRKRHRAGKEILATRSLTLRCPDHFMQHGPAIFKKHLGEFYSTIAPVSVSSELQRVRAWIGTGSCITICKDYKNRLPYVPFHRSYETPLSRLHISEQVKEEFLAGVRELQFDKSCITVIDSDAFSGWTRRTVIEILLEEGFARVDFKVATDCEHAILRELLDIEDFLDTKFNYPYYDMTSKCSLPIFNRELYERIGALREELTLIGL